MNKAVKFRNYGAIAGGAFKGLSNIIKQNQNTNKPFDVKEFLIAMAKGVLIGGTVGYGIGAVADYYNEKELPVNTDGILLVALQKFRLNKDSWQYERFSEKADWLTTLIKSKFGTKLKTEPIRFGSVEKGTALKDHSDIDIAFNFKPGSFVSTEDMHESLYQYLRKYEGVNGVSIVRRQGKSIGVIFILFGKEHKVDILPNKITRKKGNSDSGFLYVNKSGLFESPTYTKTNPSLLNNVKLTETQKAIIIILKNWKKKNEIPLGSYLLQNLVILAFEDNRGRIPRKHTDKLIMVIRFIADNIEVLKISSIENSNNVITNIPDADKAVIRSACKSIIDKYEYQPNSIVEIFAK